VSALCTATVNPSDVTPSWAVTPLRPLPPVIATGNRRGKPVPLASRGGLFSGDPRVTPLRPREATAFSSRFYDFPSARFTLDDSSRCSHHVMHSSDPSTPLRSLTIIHPQHLHASRVSWGFPQLQTRSYPVLRTTHVDCFLDLPSEIPASLSRGLQFDLRKVPHPCRVGFGDPKSLLSRVWCQRFPDQWIDRDTPFPN